MKIATAQYELTHHKNFQAYNDHVRSWVSQASLNKARLLLFPEYGSIELVSLMPIEIQKNLALQLIEMQSKRDTFVALYQSLAKEFNITIVAPSFPWQLATQKIVNRAFIFFPDGSSDYQDKQVMTRFEDEAWHISVPDEKKMTIFTVDNIKCALSICLDIEFPDFAREFAKSGVKILLAPSCTETMHGMNRVHIGARARALENQFYVIVSQTIGKVDYSEAIDLNTGKAAVYTPCDHGFTEDGVMIEGILNQSQWLYSHLDIEAIDRVRKNGVVLNFQKMLLL